MLTLKILWAIVAKSNANVIVSAVKLHSIVSYLLVIFIFRIVLHRVRSVASFILHTVSPAGLEVPPH